MIITVGAIIILIGFITAGVSIKENNTKWNVIFIVGITLIIIGASIIIIPGFTTGICRAECNNQDLIFQGQEINCQGELVCYCKAPLPPVKPKVVIVK